MRLNESKCSSTQNAPQHTVALFPVDFQAHFANLTARTLSEIFLRYTVAMNDREFREHLIKLRLERERKEAQAANAAVKKPPASAKSRKAKKTRSA